MSISQSHLRAGTARPLRLRVRPDLISQNQQYLGRRYWIIKDPLAQKYYRFEEEEFALLQMLDGEASLQELQRRFERRFAPQKISHRELHRLLGLFHRHSLVVADAAGQGRQLHQRLRKKRRNERLGRLLNILAIRFKGFDPDRLLTAMDRRCGWFFSPPWVAFCVAMGVAALLLVTSKFDAFQARLPTFQEFFASQNWLWLGVTLGLTKVLHELGHGLACKRLGGACHEMGLMLLVLMPCLYCNVTDSWMVPQKWKRAAIAAAGMYVELVLAAMATFLWWFSEPGMIHYLSLNLMFVCSISTVVFNANPLLRYDGYYILSDLLEIPNLRQKSALLLQRKAGSWLLGLPEVPDPFLPRRRQVLFVLYAIAAVVYRWVVVISILFFLNRVFEPYGLQIIGQLLAALSVAGLLGSPIVRLFQFFQVPGRFEQVNKQRLLVTTLGTASLLIAAFGISWPHYVRCDAQVQLRDAATAYVETPGLLADIRVRPGSWVDAGQTLVELTNWDVELEVARLYSEQRQLESKLHSLRQREFSEEAASLEMTEVEETLEAVKESLSQRRLEHQRLSIAAPTAGWVLQAPRKTLRQRAEQLPAWQGTPLDRENLSAFVDVGEVVCQIGDPQRLEAVVLIDQGDVEFVEAGQSVQLVFPLRPKDIFTSRLTQLAQVDLSPGAPGVGQQRGREWQTEANPGEPPPGLGTRYQGSVPFDDPDDLLVVGARGEARIRVGRKTLAQRGWRLLCQTFF